MLLKCERCDTESNRGNFCFMCGFPLLPQPVSLLETKSHTATAGNKDLQRGIYEVSSSLIDVSSGPLSVIPAQSRLPRTESEDIVECTSPVDFERKRRRRKYSSSSVISSLTPKRASKKRKYVKSGMYKKSEGKFIHPAADRHKAFVHKETDIKPKPKEIAIKPYVREGPQVSPSSTPEALGPAMSVPRGSIMHIEPPLVSATLLCISPQSRYSKPCSVYPRSSTPCSPFPSSSSSTCSSPMPATPISVRSLSPAIVSPLPLPSILHPQHTSAHTHCTTDLAGVWSVPQLTPASMAPRHIPALYPSHTSAPSPLSSSSAPQLPPFDQSPTPHVSFLPSSHLHVLATLSSSPFSIGRPSGLSSLPSSILMVNSVNPVPPKASTSSSTLDFHSLVSKSQASKESKELPTPAFVSSSFGNLSHSFGMQQQAPQQPHVPPPASHHSHSTSRVIFPSDLLSSEPSALSSSTPSSSLAFIPSSSSASNSHSFDTLAPMQSHHTSPLPLPVSHHSHSNGRVMFPSESSVVSSGTSSSNLAFISSSAGHSHSFSMPPPRQSHTTSPAPLPAFHHPTPTQQHHGNDIHPPPTSRIMFPMDLLSM
mmetsp:Transcript_14163/g.23454  ORF Transcript_14163/g.23454 Transcript_14163/m.23454 type:complete len:595 (+) Transcript_14163:126-1910(+)